MGASIMGIKQFAKSLIYLLGIILVLTGCGTTTLTQPSNSAVEPTSERHDLVFEVEISNQDKIEDIEAAYKAQVVVWQEEAGFAILAGSEGEHLAQQNVLAESNRNVISSPTLHDIVNASGVGGVFGSSSAYGSGSGVFGAGNSAFGGSSSFGSGVNSQHLTHNKGIWNQIELFSGHQATENNLGRGVRIAVIDTGVDLDHSLIKGSLSISKRWADFVDGDRIPEDDAGGVLYGHGTAVTGIILQVAPQAEIIPIRVLRPDGTGDLSNVASAIDHAIRMDANIINLSLGSHSDSSIMKTMLAYAKAMGVYVVAATGNQGQNSVNYPARYSSLSRFQGNVFGVGSVDINGQRSKFSNYGSGLDFYAPGEDVQTTFPEELWINASGTSFATPVVAGEIALLLAENLDADVANKLSNSIVGNSFGILNARVLLEGKTVDELDNVVSQPNKDESVTISLNP